MDEPKETLGEKISREQLLDAVVKILRQALQEKSPRKEKREVKQLYFDKEVSRNRTEALQGALLSGWQSFENYIEQLPNNPDNLTVEDVAGLFIRHTYNRRRRRDYRDGIIQREMANGKMHDSEGGERILDFADSKASHECMAEIKDAMEKVIESYPEIDKRIIALKIDHYSAKDIKAIFQEEFPDTPITDVKISRVWKKFQDNMRELLGEE